MNQNDEIKELFSKSFEGFEKNADPGLWDKIQNNLNNPASGQAGQTGIAAKSGIIKAVIIGASSVAIIAGGILFFNRDTVKVNEEIVLETPNTEIPEDKNETVVIDYNENAVNEIEVSEDPVIVVKKEEIKKKILQDIEEATINNLDINELLDQELLNKLKNNTNSTNGSKENKVVVSENNKTKEEKDKSSIDNNYTTTSKENIIKEKKAEEVYLEGVANVLTPNGDNINDVLELRFSGIKEFNFVIASREGKLLFETSGPSIRWTGIDNKGNALEVGAYKLIIVAIGNDGSRYIRKSFFHIVD